MRRVLDDFWWISFLSDEEREDFRLDLMDATAYDAETGSLDNTLRVLERWCNSTVRKVFESGLGDMASS